MGRQGLVDELILQVYRNDLNIFINELVTRSPGSDVIFQ